MIACLKLKHCAEGLGLCFLKHDHHHNYYYYYLPPQYMYIHNTHQNHQGVHVIFFLIIDHYRGKETLFITYSSEFCGFSIEFWLADFQAKIVTSRTTTASLHSALFINWRRRIVCCVCEREAKRERERARRRGYLVSIHAAQPSQTMFLLWRVPSVGRPSRAIKCPGS